MSRQIPITRAHLLVYCVRRVEEITKKKQMEKAKGKQTHAVLKGGQYKIITIGELKAMVEKQKFRACVFPLKDDDEP